MSASIAYLVGKLSLELDRAADQLLQEHVGISYRRFLFLTVLQHQGTSTQHELAVALGYTDPAVSSMLVELTKDGYTRTTQNPQHRRKHLVSITPEGLEVVAQGRRLLDAHFNQLLELADIDADLYQEFTERLHQALVLKMKGKNK